MHYTLYIHPWMILHVISLLFFFCLIQWAGNKSLLAVNSGETVIILNEQVMNAHYNLEVSDLQ